MKMDVQSEQKVSTEGVYFSLHFFSHKNAYLFIKGIRHGSKSSRRNLIVMMVV